MKKLIEEKSIIGDIHGSLEQHTNLFNDIHSQFISNGSNEIKTEGSYADINKPPINLRNAKKVLEKRKAIAETNNNLEATNIKNKP